MELDRNSYQQRLWDQKPQTDAHRSKPRNWIQECERNSAAAFVKGAGEFAKEQLKRRLSGNRREASRRVDERVRDCFERSELGADGIELRQPIKFKGGAPRLISTASGRPLHGLRYWTPGADQFLSFAKFPAIRTVRIGTIW